jgi:hypothetical protein
VPCCAAGHGLRAIAQSLRCAIGPLLLLDVRDHARAARAAKRMQPGAQVLLRISRRRTVALRWRHSPLLTLSPRWVERIELLLPRELSQARKRFARARRRYNMDLLRMERHYQKGRYDCCFCFHHHRHIRHRRRMVHSQGRPWQAMSNHEADKAGPIMPVAKRLNALELLLRIARSPSARAARQPTNQSTHPR